MADKNRIFRIIKIMMLLNEPYNKWNAKKIADYFDISIRTFHRDKSLMEELGIPIYYDHNLKAYRILDNFRLKSPDLDAEETEAVFLAAKEYQNRNFPMKVELESALAKIFNSLPEYLKGSIGTYIKNYEIISEKPDDQIIITAIKEQIQREKTPIIIDPGHGGFDPGAIGPSGLKEKDVALSISEKVFQDLKNTYENVAMTRTIDRFVSLRDRVEKANNLDARLFVSIHLNSSAYNHSRGTETYIAPGRTGKSLALANYIQGELVSSNDQLQDRGIKKDHFYVIKYTEMPAVLVEAAFISNPEEEKLLKDEEFKQQIAEAISRGIINFIEEEDNP